jgi:hypothetical protein
MTTILVTTIDKIPREVVWNLSTDFFLFINGAAEHVNYYVFILFVLRKDLRQLLFPLGSWVSQKAYYTGIIE